MVNNIFYVILYKFFSNYIVTFGLKTQFLNYTRVVILQLFKIDNQFNNTDVNKELEKFRNFLY